jgi:hypothetical protein
MQPETMGPLRHLVVVPGTPDRLLVLTQQAGVWALPLERDSSAEARPPGRDCFSDVGTGWCRAGSRLSWGERSGWRQAVLEAIGSLWVGL